MAIVTGHDFKIFIGSNPIAGAQNCSLKINNDLNEVATKSTGRAKTYNYGRYDYTVDSDGLFLANASATENSVTVTTHKTLIAAALAGTTLTFEFKAGASEGGYTKYSGTLLIKSGDIGAPDYKNMTFKASFQGSGDLVATDVA